MKRKHAHRAKGTRRGPYGFENCLSPSCCNPRAHGGVRWIDRCRCGATREVNQNQEHREKGPWKEPQPSEEQKRRESLQRLNRTLAGFFGFGTGDDTGRRTP